MLARNLIAVIALLCLAWPLSAIADEVVKITQGPLAGLPGKPGDQLEKIRNLPDNTWLELATPAADPKWGTPGGRSWTSEMPLAPELRGAFLYGEGVHGYAKPNGRYMDDLWFYDIQGHRWICCYLGADTKNLKLQINADGFEATAEGDLVPVAQQVHGYEMNTYDTEARRFLSMPNTHSYWETALPQRKSWLKAPPAEASPWMFDTATGKWNRLRTKEAAPKGTYGDTFIYLPGQKEAIFLHKGDVWHYHTGANRWTQQSPRGPEPPFGIDATSCYDTKRQRIYLGGGSYPVAPAKSNALWIFDVANGYWVDPAPKGAPCRGSTSYPTKNAVMVYDAAHDKVLLVFHSHHDDVPERLGVYVYDPAENAWSDQPLAVPEKLGRNREPKNGFFDPELSAIFLHSAGDSRDGGSIWVYRYRR